MKFETVIGLEIHTELNTKSKMFCSSLNNPDEKQANVNVCPICMGHPGILPVINREAVEKVIKTGITLNCQIPEYSKFDRKNYFYPDLPKGYQISQYDKPLCGQGFLQISIGDQIKKIRITRIHLEEDTGKLIHPKGKNHSLVDFNRAGVPLMELVTEPDIHSATEARKFAEELRLILRYLEVSDADMEKGQLRVEVNISLRPENSKKLGTKVEIKNLNSFKSVEKGIEYEIKRQTELLKDGKKVVQETRGWHDVKQKTFSQREKEEAHDYRYFPEPDLPIIHIKTPQSKVPSKKDFIIDLDLIKRDIQELPQERRERYRTEYNLPAKEIEIMIQNIELGEYFEKVMSELRNWVKEIEIKEKVGVKEFFELSKICSNYMFTDFQGLFINKNKEKKSFEELINPENFAELITLIYEKKISSNIAKIVLEEMFKTGADPSHIIEEKGLKEITNESEIQNIVKNLISKNPKPVEDYKKGKENALQFLIGQAMADSKGKANPEMVKKIFKKLLS